jgi:hypothetical protein
VQNGRDIGQPDQSRCRPLPTAVCRTSASLTSPRKSHATGKNDTRNLKRAPVCLLRAHKKGGANFRLLRCRPAAPPCGALPNQPAAPPGGSCRLLTAMPCTCFTSPSQKKGQSWSKLAISRSHTRRRLKTCCAVLCLRAARLACVLQPNFSHQLFTLASMRLVAAPGGCRMVSATFAAAVPSRVQLLDMNPPPLTVQEGTPPGCRHGASGSGGACRRRCRHCLLPLRGPCGRCWERAY